jgi:hypothetical protein
VHRSLPAFPSNSGARAKFTAGRRPKSRVNTLAWQAVSSSSLVPAGSIASRRALIMGVVAAAALPAPELATALSGLAANAEPAWRDAKLMSLYAAVLEQSDIYEQAERAHDRLWSTLRDQTVFAAPRHKDGDPVDGVAWWCNEEDRYVDYCHPGQIEDRRDRLFFGRADRDRFAEILVAHDRHQALRAEAGARLGVEAAEVEADTEFARLRDLENKLIAMQAFTLEGMGARAMVVFRVCWGSEAEREYERVHDRLRDRRVHRLRSCRPGRIRAARGGTHRGRFRCPKNSGSSKRRRACRRSSRR